MTQDVSGRRFSKCQYICIRSHHVKMLHILVNLQRNLYTILYRNIYNVQKDWDLKLFIYHDSHAVTEYFHTHFIFGIMIISQKSSNMWPIQFHCTFNKILVPEAPCYWICIYTMGFLKQTEAIIWVLHQLQSSFYAYININSSFQLSKLSEIYFKAHIFKPLI